MSKLTFVRVQQDKRVIFMPIDACLIIKEDEVLDKNMMTQAGKCDIVYTNELLRCTSISGKEVLLVGKHIEGVEINLIDNTTTVYFIDFSNRTAEYKVRCIQDLT